VKISSYEKIYCIKNQQYPLIFPVFFFLRNSKNCFQNTIDNLIKFPTLLFIFLFDDQTNTKNQKEKDTDKIIQNQKLEWRLKLLEKYWKQMITSSFDNNFYPHFISLGLVAYRSRLFVDFWL
jgi:hypothetical protein